ncbi:hypothetical protein QE152_g21714 [Popillia japonica]|uniref:Uncharacterized protein n=1 Tax=Popillia japonica TaxID=7064 RepID=A0AAW1KL37_POPJA
MRKPVVIFLGISGVGIVIVIVAALIVFFTYTLDTFKSPSLLRPPCDSKIFCYGDFLMHAQIWADGRDSKQLVDLAMKEDEQVIVEKFEDLLKGK